MKDWLVLIVLILMALFVFSLEGCVTKARCQKDIRAAQDRGALEGYNECLDVWMPFSPRK